MWYSVCLGISWVSFSNNSFLKSNSLARILSSSPDKRMYLRLSSSLTWNRDNSGWSSLDISVSIAIRSSSSSLMGETRSFSFTLRDSSAVVNSCRFCLIFCNSAAEASMIDGSVMLAVSFPQIGQVTVCGWPLVALAQSITKLILFISALYCIRRFLKLSFTVLVSESVPFKL